MTCTMVDKQWHWVHTHTGAILGNQEAKRLLKAFLLAYETLLFARNELGVPQPDYPAPVANAAYRLQQTLDELEKME